MKKTMFASVLLLTSVLHPQDAAAENANWIEFGPDFDRAIVAYGFTGISSVHSLFTLSGTIFGIQQLHAARPHLAPAVASIAAGAVEVALIAPVWASTDDGALLGISALNLGLAIASTTIGIVNLSRRLRYDRQKRTEASPETALVTPILRLSDDAMSAGLAVRY